MARLTFRRLLLVGVAVGAAAAYAKRDQVRQLLPGGASSTPETYSPPVPTPSNYDAPGPPANTATPVPAPEPVVTPDAARPDAVEDFPVQGDDPQAAAAAAAPRRAAGPAAPGAAAAGGGGMGGAAGRGRQGAPEPIDEMAEEQA